MLKRIFLIALSFSFVYSTAAKAAVSPLPLLVEQCLQLRSPIELVKTHSIQIDLTKNSVTADNAAIVNQAFSLEAALLSLFNIKDRLQYYKSHTLSPLYQESVVQCQLHLADLMSDSLTSAWLYKFVRRIEQHSLQLEPEIQQLGLRLRSLQDNHLHLTDKSKLHTAQATVKQGLRTQNLTLQFNEGNCQLQQPKSERYSTAGEQQNTNTNINNFNLTIAAYLIKQTDPVCQKRVWQAYQSRAKSKNKQALKRIEKIKSKQALNKGYVDFSSFELHDQYLSTPQMVKLFLNSQTQQISSPPWALGRQLANSEKTITRQITSSNLLAHVQQKAEELAFKFEVVSADMHRVWHQGRLLGDIYVGTASRTKSYVLRSPILGRQYGQIHFSVKPSYQTLSSKQFFISEYASALAALSSSSRFYLNNTLGETQDTSSIGQRWLSLFLSEDIVPALTVNSREHTIDVFSKQLKVFRSKVALNFYSSISPYKNLNDEFIASFSQAWDLYEDYPYNFYAIVTTGPLYYQDIWQNQLANYIFLATKHCKNQSEVYNILQVNEGSQPFKQRLSSLIGEPVDAQSLIKRIQDGFSFSQNNTQNQHDLACTI